MENDSNEVTDEIREWLDRPGKGVLWDTMSTGEKKITKYLAPGTVMDLYTHYQATRQLFGSVAVSYLVRIQNTLEL